MKKMLAILLCGVLLLAGCGAKQTAETQQPTPAATVPETTEQTPEATETEPETQPLPKLEAATVQADGVPEVLTLLSRGQTVEVLELADEYYARVRVGDQEGLVEQQLLRLPGAESYESWTGYARYGAALYKNFRLLGEPEEKLSVNAEVQVLDELKDCFLVNFGEKTGFVDKQLVGKYRVTYGGGNTESNSGSSSGSSAPKQGQDGGDITLSARNSMPTLSFLSQATVTGQAEVKVDGTELILTFRNRGETVQVVKESGFAPELEGYLTLYREAEEMYTYLPAPWAALESADSFETWEGYAAYGCKLFDNVSLLGVPSASPYGNTRLTVLWDGGDVLVVQMGDQIGCVDARLVRTTPIPSSGGSGNAGGSGSSGSSSGSGNSGSSSGGSGSSGGDWTPPML